MREGCLFCRIIEGREKAWKVYETTSHLTFLTPFPNTSGFTVLIPKEHISSDVFAMDSEQYSALFLATREVAGLLEKAFGCKRVGLIAEGMAIDHAHVKLVPMHGIPGGPWEPILSDAHKFNEHYQGYLSSADGPRMSDIELLKIQERILSASR